MNTDYALIRGRNFTFPWTAPWAQTVMMIIVSLVVWLTVETVVGLLVSLTLTDYIVGAGIVGVVSFVVSTAAAAAVFRRFGNSNFSPANALSTRTDGVKLNIFHALGAGILGLMLIYLVLAVIYALLPLPTPYSPAGEVGKRLSGFAFAIFAFHAVVIAPIFEEFLFRGVFQNAMRVALRDKIKNPMGADLLAVTIVAAIFSGLHMTATGFPPLFVAGFIFGNVYRSTGDLKAPILVHSLMNSVATLTLALS